MPSAARAPPAPARSRRTSRRRHRRRRGVPPGPRLAARRLPGRRRLFRCLRVPHHGAPARPVDAGAVAVAGAAGVLGPAGAAVVAGARGPAHGPVRGRRPHRPRRRTDPARRHTGGAGLRGQLAAPFPPRQLFRGRGPAPPPAPFVVSRRGRAVLPGVAARGPGRCSHVPAAGESPVLDRGHRFGVLGSPHGRPVRSRPRPVSGLLRHVHPFGRAHDRGRPGCRHLQEAPGPRPVRGRATAPS